MKHIYVSLAVPILLTTGCASSPKDTHTAYVSPLKYDHFDCTQIASEMDHVNRKTTQLYMQLKKESDADNAQMAAGLVLFWAALFFLEGGDGPQAAEYTNMKGDSEALRVAALSKKCGLEHIPTAEQIVLLMKLFQSVRRPVCLASRRTRYTHCLL